MYERIDVRTTDHGSVVRFDLLTDEARSFVDEQVLTDAWQWFGRSLVIEPRFVAHIIDAMQQEGLHIQSGSISD